MKSFFSKKMGLQLFTLWTILLGVQLAEAQEIRFLAQAPGAVNVGQRFRVSYIINGQGSDLKVGSFNGFSILSGPNQSTSTSVQIINGQMNQKVELSFNYVLQASKAGTFKLPSATVKVEGKTYRSNQPSIKVVKGAANANNSRSNNNNSGGVVNAQDLLLRMIISKREVTQGEPIVATLKLYTKLNLANLGNFKTPAFNGFWSEIIQKADQIRFQRDEFNGQVYNTAVIQQHVIIPERSGDLTIEPAELTAIAQVPTQSRSFFNRYQNVEKVLRSGALKIKVNPLPAGAPASFNGGVGDIKFNATLDPQDTKTNEAVTFKLTYSGIGNLKLLGEPNIKFPSDFEVYDPKISTNLRTGANGYSGSKVFEYLIIPRHEGVFEIPAVSFSAYDPASKSYKTLTAGPFPLNVAKGEGDEVFTGIDPGLIKEDVEELGSDIRYIRTNSITLQRKDRPFFGSLTFYLMYLLGLVSFGLLLFFIRQRRKKTSDAVYMKNRKAGKVAQSKLKNAKAMLDQGDEKGFYTETVTALWKYLSDKLNIPQGELNKKKIRSELAKHNVEETLVNEYIGLIDQCEFAQFAPGAATTSIADLYNDTAALINKVEDAFK